MKRFYKEAAAGTAPNGHTVRLDGNILRTPLRAPVILPSALLAAALAAEWAAQEGEIAPGTMPLTQLVCTMIDKAEGHERPEMEAEIVKYAASDLVCYFATHPADLVARQEKYWHPLLSWIQDEYGVILQPVSGIQYTVQDKAGLEKLRQVVRGLDAARFTVVQAVTGMTGSAVIALAMAAGRLGAAQAYEAAMVDEIFQLEKWGEDEIARKRLQHIEAELTGVEKFMFLIKASA
ncbi:MAG: ATP12 family chaperone protein [Alphaproteobacteria bacterium]